MDGLLLVAVAAIIISVLLAYRLYKVQGKLSAEAQSEPENEDPDLTPWFKELGENAQDFLWIATPEGRFLYIGSAFERIWDIPVDTLYADQNAWIRPIHSHDKGRVIKEFSQRREGTYEVEYRIVRPDGSIRWLNGRSTPIFSNGELKRIVGVVRDVTEIKKTREVLEEQAHLLANAQRLADFGTWVAENYPNGPLRWSDESCRIFGIDPKDFDHSMDMFRVRVPSDELERISNVANKAIEAGEAYSVEHKIIRPDGEVRWVREYANAEVEGKTGKVRLLGVVQDVTEYHDLQTQLIQVQKMEAVGTLAGGIAHDFNNILTAMSGHLEMAVANSNDSTDVQKQHLQGAKRSVERASSLVNQILTFSRQEPKNLQPVDIAPTVNEALGLMRASLPAGVSLEIAIDDQLPTVNADLTQIHQIVMNLVTNAWQALPEQGGQISVSLDSVSVDTLRSTQFTDLVPGAYVRLRVQDNGSGITAGLLDKIFEPFYTNKARGEGTGLGLSVVHGIVESHGAVLDLETVEGEGSRFEIYFPIANEPALAQEELSSIESTPARQKILFLDDEQELVLLADRMLTKLGHEVVAVSDPEDAIARLKSESFDLLVTDLNMPGISGLDVAAEARTHQPDLWIVLTSGNVSKDLEAEVTRVTDATLKKPYKMAELDAAINARNS